MTDRRRALGPSDVPTLSATMLSSRREYAALAAVAALAGTGEVAQRSAVEALAAAADAPEGFEWWWRFVHHFEHNHKMWASSVEKLANPVAVARRLEEEVAEFLLAGATSARQQMSNDDYLRVRIFERLPKDGALARRVAVAAASGTSVPPQMLEVAFQVLGASTKAAERDHVLQSALAASPLNLARLHSLSAPWLADESAAVASAMTKFLQRPGDTRLEAAAIVLARLQVGKLTQVLIAGAAVVPRLVNDGLTAQLGGARLQELVEAIDASGHGTPETREGVRRALVASAEKLPREQHDFALWAAKRYGNDSLGNYHAMQVRLHHGYNAERDTVTRQHLLELVLTDPAPVAEAAAADIFRFTDLTAEFLAGRAQAGLRGIGRTIGYATRGGRLTVDVLDTRLRALTNAVGVEVAAPIVAGALSVVPAPSAELLAFAGATPQGAAALMSVGLAKQAQAALTERSASPDEVIVTVEAVARLDDDESQQSVTDTTLVGLMKLIVPSQFTADHARRLVAAIGARPAIGDFAMHLLATLTGPEARQVSGVALAPVLRFAVDNGLLEERPRDDALRAARAAVHLAGVDIQEAAATWLARARLDLDVLQIVVEASEAHVRPDNPFRQARAALARRYVDRAEDPERAINERVEDLRGAAQADRAVAREGALRMADSSRVELRRAAAAVLAAQTGPASDGDLLQRLIASEVDRSTSEDLQRALRRIQSGDAGEALHNLLTTLDLPDISDQHTNTHLPYAAWHETFIDCVDDFRAGVASTPEEAAAGAIRLGEHLAEMAIARVYATGSAKQQEHSTAILDNDPKKPDIGVLVNSQDLINKLPWLHAYATLRGYRSVHPAPRGSTQPAPRPQSTAHIVELMRQVVDGWMATMRQTS